MVQPRNLRLDLFPPHPQNLPLSSSLRQLCRGCANILGPRATQLTPPLKFIFSKPKDRELSCSRPLIVDQPGARYKKLGIFRKPRPAEPHRLGRRESGEASRKVSGCE